VFHIKWLQGSGLRSLTFPTFLFSSSTQPLKNTHFRFCFWRDSPQWARASSFTRFSRSHITTHHRRYESSGRVISLSQRPVPDNTQHSQQTNIHALGGIRTHNFSRRAAADSRFRPRGNWDRLLVILRNNNTCLVRGIKII
jgi:hypothetical protein